MPTIDVEYQELERLLGLDLHWKMEKLDEILANVKAEVKLFNEQEGIVSIEMKDTNRPDLWSAEGLAQGATLLPWHGKRTQALHRGETRGGS